MNAQEQKNINGFIDELNEWLESLSDDELVEKYDKSTKDMDNDKPVRPSIEQITKVIEMMMDLFKGDEYQDINSDAKYISEHWYD